MDKEKRSQEMVRLENHLADAQVHLQRLIKKFEALEAFEPVTQAGKDAKQKAIFLLDSHRTRARSLAEAFRVQLELETIAFLSGTGTDVERFDGEPPGLEEFPTVTELFLSSIKIPPVQI